MSLFLRGIGGDTVEDINGYRIHTFSNVGTSTFTTNIPGYVEVLVIAGGGSGGVRHAGGGGAGGYVYNTALSVSGAVTVTVTVGDGGAARTSGSGNGNSGANSVFGALTAIGGGYGSQSEASGSGGSSGGVWSTYARGTAFQGFQGGIGSNGGEEYQYQGGGGGGAGAVGQAGGGGNNYKAGDGGAGLAFSISGTYTYYMGGGGGSTVTNMSLALPGLGGIGGGGKGGGYNSTTSLPGTPNTGGGGGAGGFDGGTNYSSGKGGSGIVIVRYLLSTTIPNPSINFTIASLLPASGGNTVQDIGGYRIHTFTTVGTSTLTVPSRLLVDVLVVAGGGGGGCGTGGGGGAGGLVYVSSKTLSSGSYTVIVGNGGAGNSSGQGVATNGGNSSMTGFTPAIGGGGGANTDNANAGGSGGGTANNLSGFGAGTAGQGNRGGTGLNGGNYEGGGGGGAGGVGANGVAGTPGAGGVGLAYSISSTSTYYAGGGGGGWNGAATGGLGGLGGGGNGGNAANSTAGAPNTGGGGGGGNNFGGSVAGKSGGSGIVIVRYLFPFVTTSTMQVTTGGSIQMYSRPILTPVLTNPGDQTLSIGSTVIIYQTALQPGYGITWSFSPTGYGLAVSRSSDYELTLVASSFVTQQLYTVTATNKNNVTTTTQFMCVTPVSISPFPIAGFSAAATQSVNSFTQTLTGAPYTGVYVANCSSFYSGQEAWRCFDKNNYGSVWSIATGTYTSGSGAYTGSVSTTISGSAYLGEWIQIKLPVGLFLTSYEIFRLNARSPKTFKLAGSNDGTTWTLVDTQTGVTSWVGSQTSLTFTPSAQSTAFTYYRLIVNATNGADLFLTIGELVLNGSSSTVTPVFNVLSSAAAASAVSVYSLRSLRSFYARVVNIRNGTTSATQDFYADTLGNLTTLTGGSGQTLVNWLGGATGFVATLYDQSTNGYNLAQPTTANQPPINLTTTPYSMIFDGSDLWLYNASVAFNMGAGSFTLRYVVSNNTGGCIFFKTNNTTFTWPAYAKKFWLGNGATTEGARGNFPAQVGNSESFCVSSTAITATVKNSVVHKANATNSIPIYVNGVQASLGTNNIGMSTDPGNYLIIGRGAQASNYIGNMFEIELFSTRLSDTDRLALEN